MAQFAGGWKSALVVFIASFFGLVNSEKIDAKIDVAVVTIRPSDDRDTEQHLFAAYKKLPTYFEVGQDKLQLAIVAGAAVGSDSSNDRVLLYLTADQKIYEEELDSAPPLSFFSVDWGPSFTQSRTQIFPNRPVDRAKAVVMMMIKSGRKHQRDLEEAKKLRDQGVWLYIIAEEGEDNLATEAKELTGDPQRTFVSPHSKLLDAVEKVKEAILRDLCQKWESICRYADKERNRCEFEAWLIHMNNVKQCGDAYKPPGKSCGLEDCGKECDQRWPWEKAPDCRNKCGVNDGTRRGTAPPKFENCPQWIACPPCTTTRTTTSTTTSTSTSTTTTSTSTSTGTSTTPRGRTSTSASTILSTSRSTVVTMRTTNTTTSSGDGPAIVPGGTKNAGVSSLVIAVGGIVPIVLLIIVIAVVVAVLRKRSHKKKLQAAAKSASVKLKPAVTSSMPAKKGPSGKEAVVGTGSRREAETSVAADISVSPSLPGAKSGAAKARAKMLSKMDTATKSAVKGPVVKKGAGKSVMLKGVK